MLQYLQKCDFTSLFVNELGWNYPSNNQIELTISNQKYFLKSLAEKRGFVVYECKTQGYFILKMRLRVSSPKVHLR
jgi:hypothetical protein